MINKGAWISSMSLFEFLEHFDMHTHITVVCDGYTEYEGMIADITQKILNGKEVVYGSVVSKKTTLHIGCIKMN